MTDKEKQELYENICNDINCGTYILAPQYVDKLLAKLERKIASIRGSHRVDLAKLNARIEQVERLKKENAELKKENAELKKENLILHEMNLKRIKYYNLLTKAKELLKKVVGEFYYLYDVNNFSTNYECLSDAEQFLNSEVEND